MLAHCDRGRLANEQHLADCRHQPTSGQCEAEVQSWWRGLEVLASEQMVDIAEACDISVKAVWLPQARCCNDTGWEEVLDFRRPLGCFAA